LEICFTNTELHANFCLGIFIMTAVPKLPFNIFHLFGLVEMNFARDYLKEI
jgi:hypothetical protein